MTCVHFAGIKDALERGEVPERRERRAVQASAQVFLLFSVLSLSQIHDAAQAPANLKIRLALNVYQCSGNAIL